MKKSVLITGSSGFIGKHLISTLLKLNYKLICIDLNHDTEFIANYGASLKYYNGNIQNSEFIEEVFLKHSPDYIVHLAGLKNRTNSKDEFNISMNDNYYGTLNILNAAENTQNLKRIVLMGTAEEYGNLEDIYIESGKTEPVSAYGLSKLSATLLGMVFNKQYGLPVVVLRPSIAYGPGQGNEMFIPALINSLVKNVVFDMTSGNQYRNFVYVLDLVYAIELALLNDECNGQIINIGASKSVRLIEAAAYIANKLKKKHLLNVGAIQYKKSEMMNYHLDVTKASEMLKWAPNYNFYDSLNETINYYVARYKPT